MRDGNSVRETKRLRDRETEIQRGREAERDRERQRETERDRERQKGSSLVILVPILT